MYALIVYICINWWCTYVYTDGVHMYALMVYICMHLWCTHVYTYGAHMYTLMVSIYMHLWCTYVYTYGAHMHTLMVHICMHWWCTYVYTDGVHMYTLMVYINDTWIFIDWNFNSPTQYVVWIFFNFLKVSYTIVLEFGRPQCTAEFGTRWHSSCCECTEQSCQLLR